MELYLKLNIRDEDGYCFRSLKQRHEYQFPNEGTSRYKFVSKYEKDITFSDEITFYDESGFINIPPHIALKIEKFDKFDEVEFCIDELYLDEFEKEFLNLIVKLEQRCQDYNKYIIKIEFRRAAFLKWLEENNYKLYYGKKDVNKDSDWNKFKMYVKATFYCLFGK